MRIPASVNWLSQGFLLAGHESKDLRQNSADALRHRGEKRRAAQARVAGMPEAAEHSKDVNADTGARIAGAFMNDGCWYT